MLDFWELFGLLDFWLHAFINQPELAGMAVASLCSQSVVAVVNVSAFACILLHFPVVQCEPVFVCEPSFSGTG